MRLYAEKVIPRFDHLRDESDLYEPPEEALATHDDHHVEG
jgi:hypothetical protein